MKAENIAALHCLIHCWKTSRPSAHCWTLRKGVFFSFLCSKCSVWTSHVETYGDVICPSLSCDYINISVLFLLALSPHRLEQNLLTQVFPPLSHYLWSGEFVLQPTYNYQPGSTKKGWMSLLENVVISSTFLFSDPAPGARRRCHCWCAWPGVWSDVVCVIYCTDTEVNLFDSPFARLSADEDQELWWRRWWGSGNYDRGGTTDEGHPAGLNDRYHFFLQSTVISSETKKKEGWCWPMPNLRR